MVKLVDTTDLKSVAPNTSVPVRFRSRAPLIFCFILISFATGKPGGFVIYGLCSLSIYGEKEVAEELQPNNGVRDKIQARNR